MSASAGPRAWVAGTFDTKADELHYLAGLLRAAGLNVTTVDVGTRSEASDVDYTARAVAAHHPRGAQAVYASGDRGQAGIAMSEALCVLVREALDRGAIDGMVGVGGSGGTSITAPALRLLPVGRPKLLVSTMASGDMAPYVRSSDLMTLYPVTDIAGLNRLSRRVLANAAHALAGMLTHPMPANAGLDKPALGLTMFGVTTPCVQAVCAHLQDRFDTQVFHANGAGGRTLEELSAAGMLEAVVDITTTEVGQHLAGGTCDAGPGRLDAAARFGLPWIGSVGALDMINWGPLESVPARHQGRLLHVHNANVTLMRATAVEMAAAGRRIAEQLNRSTGPVRLLLPLGGLSMLDAPGQPFHDPAADEALFEAIEESFVVSDTHQLLRIPLHINDPGFAQEIVSAVVQVLER